MGLNINKNIIAQMTVPGLLLIFLGLMVLSVLMPTIATTSTNMSVDLIAKSYDEEAILVKLIPLFIIVVFLSAIALYGAPQT